METIQVTDMPASQEMPLQAPASGSQRQWSLWFQRRRRRRRSPRRVDRYLIVPKALQSNLHRQPRARRLVRSGRHSSPASEGAGCRSSESACSHIWAALAAAAVSASSTGGAGQHDSSTAQPVPCAALLAQQRCVWYVASQASEDSQPMYVDSALPEPPKHALDESVQCGIAAECSAAATASAANITEDVAVDSELVRLARQSQREVFCSHFFSDRPAAENTDDQDDVATTQLDSEVSDSTDLDNLIDAALPCLAIAGAEGTSEICEVTQEDTQLDVEEALSLISARCPWNIPAQDCTRLDLSCLNVEAHQGEVPHSNGSLQCPEMITTSSTWTGGSPVPGRRSPDVSSVEVSVQRRPIWRCSPVGPQLPDSASASSSSHPLR